MSNLVRKHHDFWHRFRRDMAGLGERLSDRPKPPFPIEWLLDPPEPTLLDHAIVGWDWSLKPTTVFRDMKWAPANTRQSASRLLRGMEGLESACDEETRRWQIEGRNLARELRGLPPLPVWPESPWKAMTTVAVATAAIVMARWLGRLPAKEVE